mgnify:CR=1 FL=1
MAAFRISPSFPCWLLAEVAIAMLWGDMILPPVAPTVLAADNQSGLTLMCPATLACSFPKRIFDEVSLPVMKVPRHPMTGAKSG